MVVVSNFSELFFFVFILIEFTSWFTRRPLLILYLFFIFYFHFGDFPCLDARAGDCWVDKYIYHDLTVRHWNMHYDDSVLSFGVLPIQLAMAQTPIAVFTHPRFTLFASAVTSDTLCVPLLYGRYVVMKWRLLGDRQERERNKVEARSKQ